MPSHSGMPEKTACNVCNVSHSFHREETDTETQRSGLRLIDRENTWMRVDKILLMAPACPFSYVPGGATSSFYFSEHTSADGLQASIMFPHSLERPNP
jgi:hypothetical protein